MQSKKKKIVFRSLIVLLVTVLLIFFIVPFFGSVFRMIDKFHELNAPVVSDTSYQLKSEQVLLTNINTRKEDTIRFSGIKLINFWASWCGPCLNEMPSLQNFQSKRPNVEVLLFSFDDIDSQKKVYTERHWTLPAFLITDTANFPKPSILPVTYVVKDSTVLSRIIGARTWDDDNILKLVDSLSK